MDLIPLDHAQRHVLDRCPPSPVEEVPLDQALRLVLAAPVVAADPVPPFDNTAMDGYALRAADTTDAPVVLDVIAELAAGAVASVEVGPGQAVRIMTGAPVPQGADAIVMVEATSTGPEVGDGRVRIEKAAGAGDHIRRAGEDVEPGSTVLVAGSELSPAHLGVLANVGRTTVEVRRRPVVGVLSTGDELVEAPAPLGPGQIRDSNRRALLAAVTEAGCHAVDLGLVPDTEEAIEATLRDGVTRCDALVSTGGVSVGDYDLVKTVLDRLGEMEWMQIAIKPAKPFAFGLVGDTPVFGLPGNPVSCLVSFELFARPALRQMMGHRSPGRPHVRAVAPDGLLRRPGDGKTHFMRVICEQVDGGFAVREAGGQGSHQLTAMAHANALAVVPDGPGIEPGETVSTMLLDDRWADPCLPGHR